MNQAKQTPSPVSLYSRLKRAGGHDSPLHAKGEHSILSSIYSCQVLTLRSNFLGSNGQNKAFANAFSICSAPSQPHKPPKRLHSMSLQQQRYKTILKKPNKKSKKAFFTIEDSPSRHQITIYLYNAATFFSSFLMARLMKSLIVVPVVATKAATRE